MNQTSIDPSVWKKHTWQNRFQSLLLISLMGAFLALLGWLLWGIYGLIILLISGGLFILISPTASPALVMRLYRAKTLTYQQAPTHYVILQALAQRAKLSKVPTLYYLPTHMVNAFAVGRKNQSAIAVTEGLLNTLNTREFIGVMAHEISHIQHNDIWVMGLADLFSRLTTFLSLTGLLLLLINLPLVLISAVSINWFAILVLIVAPSLISLAQLGLSRVREYDADLNASRLTGDPEGLAIALIKIERAGASWMERIFLPGRRIPEPSLLRTHPSTEERVQRLIKLQGSEDFHQNKKQIYWVSEDIRPFSQKASAYRPRWRISGLWH